MHHFSITVPEDILITVIIVCNNKRAIYHRTLLPSIFMTGVHPPSPHPKSPMWQRTVTGAWPRQSITSWLAFDLLNMRSAFQHKFGSRIEELDNHNNSRPWGWIVKQLITYRAKLLNADWLRQRAFFLNQEGIITWCWLAEHACIKLVSRFKRILKRNFRNASLLSQFDLNTVISS